MPSSPASPKISLPPFAIEKVCKSLTVDETIDAQIQVLGVPEAWRISQGDGVRVAVLDTAGESGHPDLRGQILCELCRDFTGAGLEDKGSQHGVFVSGLVSAKEDQRGIIGTAPKAKIILVRCLDNSGQGSIEAVRAGLRYCLEIKPDLVSMSLGMAEDDEEFHEIIKKLYALDIPIISASGNDGLPDSVNYPARYPETIAVGATDRQGKVAYFSSRGSQVDIMAPGCQIYSLYGKDSFSRMSGTSMATPIISGIVALLIAKHRKQEAETGKNDCKTVEQIREHLKKHAKALGDPEAEGAGLVDPNASLAEGEPVATAQGLPWSPTAWELDNDYIVYFGSKGTDWASPDGWLTIRGGVWNIRKGYRWDGSSGVPDFVRDLDPITGKARDYYASLVHDIGYRYLRQRIGFPYSKWQIDFFFFRLLKQYGFKFPKLYFLGVLLFGGWAL